MSSKLLACVATLALSSAPAMAQTKPDESQKIWEELKPEIFGAKEIAAETSMVSLEVPKRAQDAGLVPVDIVVDPAKVKAVTLVIDVNPSPLAATFTLGEGSGVSHISTRVRVNDYSFVRAIAEANDGTLHMTQKFVKASGGCSAPAVKSPAEAKATMGVMKLRQFAAVEAGASTPRDIQLMVRHPNNSGFQMDLLTRNFIPPHFVKALTVSQDDKQILKMEGGISISEDPNFRFDYRPNGAKEIEAVAVDTDGLTFKSKWPVDLSGATQ